MLSAKPQSTEPAQPGSIEPANVSFWGVTLFVLGLAVILIIILICLRAMFAGFKSRSLTEEQQLRQSDVVITVAAGRANFPQPREQVSPQLDLQNFRVEQAAELNSYGWVDRKAGVVRIPIDRAMELILGRGLPTRKGSNAPATANSTLQLQQQRPVSSTPPSKEEAK